MPLTPAATDKFTKVGNPGTATTLSAPGYTTGVSTSIQVGSTTNWPTDTKVIFAVDRAQIVNGVEVRIAGTYNEFEGIVTGANTISSMVKRYGTAQNYAAGSLTRVYIPVAATRENDLIDGLNQDHNGKGNHKTLTDDNGNEWLERAATVAAAVNQFKLANAATGNKPVLSAAGDDANVSASIVGKGTGVIDIDGAVPQKLFDILADFVESGGVVVQTTGLITSFSDIVYWINGKRYSKTSVTNRTWSANKDGYVDIDITGTVTYTEVANGAASPALAANSIRLAKVVTAAAVSSVTQSGGQDSIGNPIYWPTPTVNNLAQQIAVTPTPAMNTGGAFIDATDSLGAFVPVIVGKTGMLKVTVHANHSTGIVVASGNYMGTGFRLSGANTLVASDANAIFNAGGSGHYGSTFLVTGLLPGLTTLTMQYKSNFAAIWGNRRLLVEVV
jgi:hypothetical protein